MASTQAGTILRHIRGLTADLAGEVTDSDLLARYTDAHEEAAFAALVRRHGPLVLGVCRRVLGNADDAEDAFQAAFLALARKAESIRKRESVGCWLYRVAFHTAMRARGQAAARKKVERQASPHPAADPLAEVTGRELLTVLDEELQALPERYRAPLVLCYLQGLTCDEAARHAGWAVRTLKRRLDQARERLRGRLSRRGLTLPAALLATGLTQAAEVPVPARLTGAAVRVAVSEAGETAPAGGVAALAAGVAGAAGAPRLKYVAALLLLGSLITCGAVALAQQAAPLQVPQAGTRIQLKKPAPALPPAAQSKPGKPVSKGVRVSGRVLGSDGKPLAGAEVALVGRLRPSPQTPKYENELLALVKTDAEGRFRLARKDLTATPFYHLDVLATARGHGLGWHRVVRGGVQDELDLRLEPERVLRGRLIDLQGLPANGVKGRMVYLAWKELRGAKGDLARQRMQMEMMRAQNALATTQGGGLTPFRRPGGFDFGLLKAPAGLAFWPPTFTTDAQGRFEVRGLSAGQEAHLLIEDDRFALQELQLDTGAAKAPAEASLSLAPAQRIEGRVVYADTGKPAAGAAINLSAFRGNVGKDLGAVADAQGRFAVNLYPGTFFQVRVWPQAGQPYLSVQKRVNWPKGATRQTVDFALPRGVEVRGKAIETPAGKPRAGVQVYFAPRRDNEVASRYQILVGSYLAAVSAADGSFRLIVPPGPGHLLVDAKDPNFILKTTSAEELQTGTPGGQSRFHHEVVPINLELKDSPRELEIKVRRGVTLRGTVLGPDGKPVARGMLLCPRELLSADPNEIRIVFPGGSPPHGLIVENGRFELPGCDPDKTYRVYLLDAMIHAGIYAGLRADAPFRKTLNGMMGEVDAKAGAVAEISAAKAKGGELTIRLQPCGTAQVRLRDADGKPARAVPWVELEVIPDRGKLLGERATLGLPMRHPQGAPLAPDAEGRVTVRGLIPGATYRLRAFDFRGQSAVQLGAAFTVASGKTRKLPDAVAPAAP
jgi:RNA polymerase sigma factor (sigma-70 family)